MNYCGFRIHVFDRQTAAGQLVYTIPELMTPIFNCSFLFLTKNHFRFSPLLWQRKKTPGWLGKYPICCLPHF
jgi:hypothetical protein